MIAANTFSYNGLDTRVGMWDSTGSKTFRRAGVGVTAPVLSDGTADFTPSGEKRGSVKTTYHSALKNSDIQTDSSGAVSASVQFDAFGNVLSGSGTWKGQFGYAGKFGYQQDPDTGLKLLGHRYYDSDTGRFLTRDPAKDGRNWYSYCRNNPVTYYDAEGLKPRPLTASERQQVQDAIAMIRLVDPNTAKSLQYLLDNDLIMVDDRLHDNILGLVSWDPKDKNKGKIILNKRIFKRRFRLIATLVHELIHVRRFNRYRGDLSKAMKRSNEERLAIVYQMRVLERLRSKFPHWSDEIDEEIGYAERYWKSWGGPKPSRTIHGGSYSLGRDN